MAELKRKFTARDAYNLMMRESASAREDYEAARIAETIYSLTAGADYQGSGAQAKNKSYVNSIGKGLSSGSASRYRMLQDADKEELAQMFTEEFNKALPGFTSIMDFNKWATTMGDWYQEDLRGKHSTIVRNALTGRSKKAAQDFAMVFVDKHSPNWMTNDYDTQQKIKAELFAATKGNPEGPIWRAEVMNTFTGILPAQGQFTERNQAIKEEKWAAEQSKTKTDETEAAMERSMDMVANDIVADAAECVLAGDGSEKAREACLQKAKDEQSKTYKHIVKQISEDVRKKFDAESPKPTKLQTEDYWDPKLREYVSATDQEARDQGLQPTQMGALAKPEAPDDLQTLVALEMIRDPNSGFTADMWHYYNEDMRRVNTVVRDRPQDAEGVVRWLLEVQKRREKAKEEGLVLRVMKGEGEGSGAIKSVIAVPTDE